MKARQITFEKLVQTARFENERASITVELEKGDSPLAAFAAAKAAVYAQLGLTPNDDEYTEAKVIIEEYEKTKRVAEKLRG